MKISRIALASLISFGVLGGASLNASASHHSHYQRILWNKTMSHHKVALKNGKGIIWNKPYKTAKNAKIKYRISHKKGLVLTTIRHMKVKGGSIYYFVKAGKVTGWINKKSVKLINNNVGVSSTIVPTSIPSTPASTSNASSKTTNTGNNGNNVTKSVPSSSNTSSNAPVQPNIPSTHSESDLKDSVKAVTKVNSIVYSDIWHGANPAKDKKLKSLETLAKGATVEVLGSFKVKHGTALKIRTAHGTIGYIKSNELAFDKNEASSNSQDKTSDDHSQTNTPKSSTTPTTPTAPTKPATPTPTTPTTPTTPAAEDTDNKTSTTDITKLPIPAHSDEATLNANNLTLYANSWKNGKQPASDASNGIFNKGTKVIALENDKTSAVVHVITETGATGYISRDYLTFNK